MENTIWPIDEEKDLNAFYGKHELGNDGMPTDRWESLFLTTIQTPFPLRLSWQTDQVINRIKCHKVVADSLQKILGEIYLHYDKSLEFIRETGMDLFGGCYNYRPRRHGSRLSLHAWGAAIDLDPDHNLMGEKKFKMSPEIVYLFKKEGWSWGGDWSSPDAMHFQATSPSVVQALNAVTRKKVFPGKRH
jgi:hypothetical protein